MPESSPRPDRRFTFAKTSGCGARIFVGYARENLDRLFQDFGARVRNDNPAIVRHNAVEMVPLKRLGTANFAGGVFADGRFLPELALHRGWKAKRRSHIHEHPLESTVVGTPRHVPAAWFGGYIFGHFGHFLLEGLSRCASADVRSSALPIIFFNPGSLSPLPKFILDLFARIGIAPERILTCGPPTRVDELFVQQQDFEIRGFVNTAHRPQLVRADAAVAARDLVYLSRSKLRAEKRRIEGERALEVALKIKLGAHITYPEKLTIAEQTENLSGAGIVAACEGSALHLLTLCQPCRNVVVLCNDVPHMNFLLCDELIASDVAYVRCPAEEGCDRGSWSIDAAKARRVLESLAYPA